MQQTPFLISTHLDTIGGVSNAGPDQLVSKVSDWLSVVNRSYVKELTPDHISQLEYSLARLVFELKNIEPRFSRSHLLKLLSHHSTLTNLSALTSGGSLDDISGLTAKAARFSALDMLFIGCRSKLQIDRSKFFGIDSVLASEWYGQYFYGSRCFANITVHQNLKDHLRFWDFRMTLRPAVSNGYMRSTYIDHAADRFYKSNFNSLVRTSLNVKVENRPNPKKLAVVTGRWSPVNPTYKNRFEFFAELAKRFELTLYHAGRPRTDLETSLFKEVKNVQVNTKGLQIADLSNNEFSIIFYPDIGMNLESRLMSNIRFAPVQMTTNSHPVSTFCSEIDYFVTGRDSESVSLPNRFYSEKLILLTGIGTRPILGDFQYDVTPTLDNEPHPVLIACPWGCLKINSELMGRVREIYLRMNRSIRFRFLLTIGQDGLFNQTVEKDFREYLPKDSFEIFHDQRYDVYMERLKECDFALDAFPFGGNTSVVDCFKLKIPIVVEDGWQFYNRAGPVMLRNLGLNELVAVSRSDYVEKALYLASDEKALIQVKRKLRSTSISDLEQSFSKPDELAQVCSALAEETIQNCKDHGL